MKTPKLLHSFLQLSITILFFAQAQMVQSQVSGCKDPAATNYNPSATINDGSCTYSNTFYTPPVKVDPISSTLIETSGLQMAGNFLWSFNDGGNAAAIYRMDTITDAILQTVNLGGTTNIDWEDIAFDGTHFFIGDFGNNGNGARIDLKIYKFPLSAIPDYITNPVATIASGQIEIISFTYADQVPVTPTTANNSKWDCEAMIVDAGKIHLFSKNWIDLNTTHYVINGIAAGSYVAAPLETLATTYLVTGADKVAGSNVAVLLGYQVSGFYNHFMHVLSDFSNGFYFNGNKRRIDLPNVFSMGQAEGICFRNNAYGYISNERVTSGITVTQKLRSFNIAGFVPAYMIALPLHLANFNVVNSNGKHRISWNFSAPVKNVKLLGSSNNIGFTELYGSLSANGVMYHSPANGLTCYKLTWQQADGNKKYSNTVCVDSEVKNGLQNIILHKNGELNFILNGNEPGNYLFRLVTTDGKVIVQAKKSIAPGINSIQFGNTVNSGSFVFLQAVVDKEVKGFLLRVE